MWIGFIRLRTGLIGSLLQSGNEDSASIKCVGISRLSNYLFALFKKDLFPWTLFVC